VIGRGQDANPRDGDRVHAAVTIANGRVADARFSGNACDVALAAGDAIRELVVGARPDEAAGVPVSRILRAMHRVAPENESCVLAAIGALRSALADAATRSSDDARNDILRGAR
jgi:NifU-like protein involved in Fe-S cluster formation